MLSNWPIRVKFLVGLGLLVLLVVILAGSGLYTTYAYRSLAKDLSWRAAELPAASELSHQVGNLQMTVSELRGHRGSYFPDNPVGEVSFRVRIRDQFASDLDSVDDALNEYREHLERKLNAGSPMADDQHEWETVRKIETAMERLRQKNRDWAWMLNDAQVDELRGELEDLQKLSETLPSYLYDKMSGFADEVRNQYRTLIVGMWIASISAALIFMLWVKLFYHWIFRPLRILIAGSREVAAGHFSRRIHLDTRDEMAELAEAMNDMTARFQAIRDDLDRQVRERTKQVVRSEQLASVGFLAAGVAHEINNPLASIAMCAESLEGRFQGMLDGANPQHTVVQSYLRMIQTEAFRCKEITEKLLDFSRIGQSCRQNTDLVELVQGVIEMLRHLGKYQRKEIQLQAAAPVIASVNPQEIKQVVLNLLTNALDSIDENGTVRVEVGRRDGFAELAVVDDGCGMRGGPGTCLRAVLHSAARRTGHRVRAIDQLSHYCRPWGRNYSRKCGAGAGRHLSRPPADREGRHDFERSEGRGGGTNRALRSSGRATRPALSARRRFRPYCRPADPACRTQRAEGESPLRPRHTTHSSCCSLTTRNRCRS